MQNKELVLGVETPTLYISPSYGKDKKWPKRCASPGQQMKYLGNE